MNKYHATKRKIDGITFDSTKEAQRYLLLKEMAENGEISDLRLQVVYELIPSQRRNGKVAERAVKYVADFVYIQNGETVVEDVKGCRRGQAYALFTIKRKLMLYRYGIQIKEI